MNFVESLLQDLRYGLRMLGKNPGFTAVVLLTLGLGIGANTAVFGLANAIFFNPLPTVQEPKRLMVVHEGLPDGSCCGVPPKSFQALRRDTPLFAQTAAYIWTEATFPGDPLPERFEAAKVSREFFSMLGARFVLGRNFLPEEFQPGRSVTILSYGFWQNHFAEDRNVIGRMLRLEDREITIVGVAASDFDFPTGAQLWMPLALSAQDWNQVSPGELHTLGMLESGLDEKRARPKAAALAAALERDYPPGRQKLELKLHPFREQINGNLTPVFTMTLMGAAGFLLLIACTNVANLLLARGLARKREITLRTALGARPTRVVRQLLIEPRGCNRSQSVASRIGAAGLRHACRNSAANCRLVATGIRQGFARFWNPGHSARCGVVRRHPCDTNCEPKTDRMFKRSRRYFLFSPIITEASQRVRVRTGFARPDSAYRSRADDQGICEHAG